MGMSVARIEGLRVEVGREGEVGSESHFFFLNHFY